LEIVYCIWKGKKYFTFQDTVTNIGTAIGSQCVNLIVVAVILISFDWLYDNYAIWEIKNTWWSISLLLILIDFLFYWFHRWGHSINFLWAAHMPHHSSEEMNLSVGLRASLQQRLFAFSVFWPLPILGWDASTVYAVVGIHIMASYWHHTRVIGKLGWFEILFNSPSHHRVHHGVNPQYLDKNFGEFLIIWDKMFGTFALEEEEVCYGVTHPPRTWDPMNVYFQYWLQLWQDAVDAPIWIDKFRLWFMPLGWRPRGLVDNQDYEGSPGYSLSEQVKFKSKQFKGVIPYLIFHVSLGLVFMYLVVNSNLVNTEGLSLISTNEKIAYSFLLFLMITSWGGILEAKFWAIVLEILRLLACGYMGSMAIIGLGWANEWLSLPVLGYNMIMAISIIFISGNFKASKTEGELTEGMPLRKRTAT
jgi:sterol desaturase/sphingolipid hydroxylase (fatty acid hydroxylase superfamily)